MVSKEIPYHKLDEAVEVIFTSTKKELKSSEHVADIIRSAGLSYDPRMIYGADNHFMNESRFGSWQIPVQFANCLVLLSEYKIESFIEVGTFKGWTSTLLAAYLKKLNPGCKGITIDLVKHTEGYSIWEELSLRYVQNTSEVFREKIFDLCFIDGDHSNESVREDFNNLGEQAKICIIHDINEELCPSVKDFWLELKEKDESDFVYHEFLEHSESKPVMGLGVRIRR